MAGALSCTIYSCRSSECPRATKLRVVRSIRVNSWLSVVKPPIAEPQRCNILPNSSQFACPVIIIAPAPCRAGSLICVHLCSFAVRISCCAARPPTPSAGPLSLILCVPPKPSACNALISCRASAMQHSSQFFPICVPCNYYSPSRQPVNGLLIFYLNAYLNGYSVFSLNWFRRRFLRRRCHGILPRGGAYACRRFLSSR